ncbi:MAG: hypothetical protein Q9160_001210 [Pyrenula sp. 1 TL-2023]
MSSSTLHRDELPQQHSITKSIPAIEVMFLDGAIPELPEDEENRRRLWYEHNPEYSYPCGRIYERDRPAAPHSSAMDNVQAELDDLESRCVDLKEISEEQYRWDRHNLLQKGKSDELPVSCFSRGEVEYASPHGYFGASRLWMSFFEDIDLELDFEMNGRFCDLAPRNFAKAWRKIEGRIHGAGTLRRSRRVATRISSLVWLYETWQPEFERESSKYESWIHRGSKGLDGRLDPVDAVIAEMDLPPTHAMEAILTRIFALRCREKHQRDIEEEMWARCQEHLIRAADEQFPGWTAEDKERDAIDAEIAKAQAKCRELQDKINRHQDIDVPTDSDSSDVSDCDVLDRCEAVAGDSQSALLAEPVKDGSKPQEHDKRNKEGSKKRTAQAAGLEERTEEQLNPKLQKTSRKRDDSMKSRQMIEEVRNASSRSRSKGMANEPSSEKSLQDEGPIDEKSDPSKLIEGKRKKRARRLDPDTDNQESLSAKPGASETSTKSPIVSNETANPPGEKKKRPRKEYDDNENENDSTTVRPRKKTKRTPK